MIEAESDSSEVISYCSDGEEIWNEATSIFADCFAFAAQIGNVDFGYCPRKINKAAHEIARISYINKSFCNWVDEPPSFIFANSSR
jgi:hypothetical protein